MAKWIEAASYSLATAPDPGLAQLVDEAMELLTRAQQADGYLNTYFTVVEPGRRWTDLRDAHELYCAGHLIEAAVAHVEATGEHGLLDVVMRYADHISEVFGPGTGQRRGYSGHPEIELALMRLFRATGQERYRSLCSFFIDERGRQPYYFEQEAGRRGTPGYFGSRPPFDRREQEPERFREYNQSHLPVREQHEAVGHAVRAMYLYSGMADVAAETGDSSLAAACRRLWQHVTTRRMYVTGGLGSTALIEGFTADFDLPNETAYAETCAAIGLVFWAHRMVQLERDSRYTDVLELALYNGVLAGISMDGTRFSYDNPLASLGDHHRQAWFGVACCPPNVARLITSLGRYAYTQGEHEAVVHLFVAGAGTFELAGSAVAGELDLDPVVRAQLVGMSAATIDRRLAPERAKLRVRGHSGTKPGVAVEVCDPDPDLGPVGRCRPRVRRDRPGRPHPTDPRAAASGRAATARSAPSEEPAGSGHVGRRGRAGQPPLLQQVAVKCGEHRLGCRTHHRRWGHRQRRLGVAGGADPRGQGARGRAERPDGGQPAALLRAVPGDRGRGHPHSPRPIPVDAEPQPSASVGPMTADLKSGDRARLRGVEQRTFGRTSSVRW